MPEITLQIWGEKKNTLFKQQFFLLKANVLLSLLWEEEMNP